MGWPPLWLALPREQKGALSQFKAYFCVGSKKSRLVTPGGFGVISRCLQNSISTACFLIKHLITHVLHIYVLCFPNAWHYCGC